MVYSHLGLSEEIPVLNIFFGHAQKNIDTAIGSLKSGLKKYGISEKRFFYADRSLDLATKRFFLPLSNFFKYIGVACPIIIDWKLLASISYAKKMKESHDKKVETL